jgi:hypothetical protein
VVGLDAPLGSPSIERDVQYNKGSGSKRGCGDERMHRPYVTTLSHLGRDNAGMAVLAVSEHSAEIPPSTRSTK